MRKILTLARVALASAALAAVAAQPALATDSCPLRSDSQCIDTARSGVGSPYSWGHARWSTSDRSWGGADCSGFVVKAWQVPRSSPITEDYHPYGTWHLFNTTYHWYAIGRKSAWKSDIAGYSDPDGSGPATGHVVMYYYGDPYGTSMVLEAPGSGLKIRQAWRDLSASRWGFRRRHHLTQTSGPA